MSLCKVIEIKNITDELAKKWRLENMWFSFYKPPFHIPMYCDFSKETIKELKENYDKEKIETLYINDVNELFNHEKIIHIINNKSFPLIRFYTKGNELRYYFEHNQHINGFSYSLIGTTSDHMIDLIDDKISRDLLNKD